ncbi:hypothetical protein BKA65DRAFT_483381 [Rhexocercosporidium sp. MPI-PUGE-AT-0058]|nr:hypothetical protein BKA65DRAFT_483381 [Rhexocercosporidium sp. MPI-PUGE-AT-0058]
MINGESTVSGTVPSTSTNTDQTPVSSGLGGASTSVQDSSSSSIFTSGSDTPQSTASATSNVGGGLPGVITSTAAPKSSPTVTPGPTTTTSKSAWIPTRISGSVTVETVTFNFNLLTKPSPRRRKVIESAASAFDILGSAFSAFSSAVSSNGATDSSVAAAGSGLFNLFTAHSQSIGLLELDESGKLLDMFQETEIDIFELGTVIKDVEPLLKSTLNLINGKKILGYSGALVGGLGIGASLRKLVNMANEPPSNKPTFKPGTTTTQDPSSSARPSETPKLYCIETVMNTTPSEYEAFINSLPDAGKGFRIDYPTIKNLVYGTYLTEDQAKEVRKNAIVKRATLNSAEEDRPGFYNEENSVIPRKLASRADPDPALNLVQQAVSPPHLNLISQGPKNAAARRSNIQPIPAIPDYLLSPKAGEGITIFIVDTGLNPNHPEFVRSYRQDDYFIVPNHLMGLPQTIVNPDNRLEMIDYVPDPDTQMSESMTRNHGTCVASLATEVTYGVAKKAHLVPVKYTNSRGQATELAVQSAFRYVIDRVIATNSGQHGPIPRPGYSRKNGLYGYPREPWLSGRNMLNDLLEQCWPNDIVTVIAARNEDRDETFGLHEDVPACLGTLDNALITVGACNAEGDRTPKTTRDLGKGTSFATPQIAGLTAYFMSLDRSELSVNSEGQYSQGQFIGPDLYIKGQVSMDVRNYVHNKMSYKRIPDHPDAVNVAYNGAEDKLCSLVPGTSLKRKRGGIQGRADEFGLSPVVVSGVLDHTATYPLVRTHSECGVWAYLLIPLLASMSSVFSDLVCCLGIICPLNSLYARANHHSRAHDFFHARDTTSNSNAEA